MHEVQRRDGSVALLGDFDDRDEVVVEAVVTSFTPVKGGLRCECGAELRPWNLRCTAADSAEITCHRCHCTQGRFGLRVRVHR